MNTVLAQVVAIAFLVEVTTNFVKTVVPDVDKKYITIIAGTVGIIIAVLTRVGVLAVLDIPIKYQLVDYILTGILVSRGANIVHDFAKALNLAG